MLLLTPHTGNKATLSFKTGTRKTEVELFLSEERRVEQVKDAVGKLILRTVEKYVNHRRKILTEKTKPVNGHKITQLLYVENKLLELQHSRTRGIANGVLQVFHKLRAIAPTIHSIYYTQDTILLSELHRLCSSVMQDDNYEIKTIAPI